MENKQIQELMFKAFKKGQEKNLAEDYPIKLWVMEEIQKELKK